MCSKVTNGCSGNCCRKFTLSVTIKDLQFLRDVRLSGEPFTSNVLESGHINYALPLLEELEKLIDMLIPLGTTNIDPQSMQDIATLKGFEKDKHSKEYVLQHSNGFQYVDPDDENRLISKIYTCKYFDTVNSICTNYENRPQLCRQFGDTCRYKNCTYVEKIEDEREAFLEGQSGYLKCREEIFINPIEKTKDEEQIPVCN